ncbi:hypothetical protein GCM10025331_60080 [Actinoplanes utahensis]|nr:hypothetical protein Aut01nite_43960 [Actinoplanes utahensis]
MEGAGPVVHRTARLGLRLTRGQRRRCFGLRSAGDVWACVLEVNDWRRHPGDKPVAGYQELCRLLAASGPGTFAELDAAGAVVTHRRAGRHLPGVGPARRDPRRHTAAGSVGPRRPAPPPMVGSRSPTPVREDPPHHRTTPGECSWTPH